MFLKTCFRDTRKSTVKLMFLKNSEHHAIKSQIYFSKQALWSTWILSKYVLALKVDPWSLCCVVWSETPSCSWCALFSVLLEVLAYPAESLSTFKARMYLLRSNINSSLGQLRQFSTCTLRSFGLSSMEYGEPERAGLGPWPWTAM